MPGKRVKNWSMYEALRREGKSKESSARITNAAAEKAPAQDEGPNAGDRMNEGGVGFADRNRPLAFSGVRVADVATSPDQPPALSAADCSCRPYFPRPLGPDAALAYCADCGGWIKRPPEAYLKVKDRKARKRAAYRLAGLRHDGNPRKKPALLKSVPSLQVKGTETGQVGTCIPPRAETALRGVED